MENLQIPIDNKTLEPILKTLNELQIKPIQDPYNFTDKYNTKLSPQDEQKFQEWAIKKNKINDLYDYDLRGAWKELTTGTMKESSNGHLGDTYKKPNHPTFSTFSKYNGVDGFYGGKWTQEGKQMYFSPSDINKEVVGSPDNYQKYFNRADPNVKLK